MKISATALIEPGWILSDGVSNELLLQDEQRRRIAEINGRAKRIGLLQIELVKLSLQVSEGEQITECASKLRNEFDSIERDLAGVLLPSQRVRLVQLRRRQLIAQLGLEASLYTEFSEKIGADEFGRAKLRDVIKLLRAEAEKVRTAENRKLVDGASRILSADQRKHLQEAIGQPDLYCAPSIEMLVWQAQQAGVAEPNVDPPDTINSLMRASVPWYVNLDGTVSPSFFYPHGAFTGFFEFCDGQFYGDIELIASQLTEIAAPTADFTRERRSTQVRIEALRNDWLAGKIEYKEYEMPTRVLQTGIERWRINRFIEGLLPHQRPELDRMMRRRWIALRGLHSYLVHGIFPDAPVLSDDQKRRVIELTETQVDSLGRAARTLEDKIWAAIKEAVGAEGTSKIEDIIGPRSSHLAPCPDLLLQLHAP
jgi:hypothetical protein